MAVLSSLLRAKGHQALATMVLLLGVLLNLTVAEAQSSEVASAGVIVVTFDPGAVEQKMALAAVKAHVSGLPVRVVVEPQAGSQALAERLAKSGALALERGALGTFSIEVGAGGDLLVFFTEPDGNAALIRRLPATQEGLRVAIEQAAIVVRSLVEALLEGRRIGMSEAAEVDPTAAEGRGTPEAEAPLAELSQQPQKAGEQNTAGEVATSSDVEEQSRADEPSRPSKRKFSLSGSYQGTDFSTSTAWQSGFALGARWMVLPFAYGAARYTFFPSTEAGSAVARVAIHRHPFEVLVGYAGSALLAPNAEAGVQVDYTSRDTLATGAAYGATSSEGRFLVALTARAGITWSPSAALEFTLRGGADFLLTRYSYVAYGSPALISPSAIRPKLEVELTFALW